MSKKYPMPLNVLDVEMTARDVNHIVYRVMTRLRAEWAEQTPVPPGTNPFLAAFDNLPLPLKEAMKRTWREVRQIPAANEPSPESPKGDPYKENQGRAPTQEKLLTRLRETQQAPTPRQPPPAPDIVSSRTPHAGGRKPETDPEFQKLAAALWRANQGSSGRVKQDGLERIAKSLDESRFKPSDCLEETAARDLNEHNKQFGNSPKKLKTWTDIAERGEKDQKQAMRKVLSRCAGNINAQHPETHSG